MSRVEHCCPASTGTSSGAAVGEKSGHGGCSGLEGPLCAFICERIQRSSIPGRTRTKGCSDLLVIPESRSDIRDPATLRFVVLHESHWVPAFAGMTSLGLITGS